MPKRLGGVMGICFGLALTQMPVPALARTRYVQIVPLPGHRLSMLFTEAGWRLIGKRSGNVVPDATCTRLGRSVGGTTASEETNIGHFGVDHHRLTYTPLLDPKADFCEVSVASLTRRNGGFALSARSQVPLFGLPLTRRGAAYINDDYLARPMLFVLRIALELATRSPDGRIPDAGTITRQLHNAVPLVSVSTASATPAPGAIGFYTDGRSQASVIASTQFGERLYVDLDGSVTTTNIAEHLLRVLEGSAALFTA